MTDTYLTIDDKIYQICPFLSNYVQILNLCTYFEIFQMALKGIKVIEMLGLAPGPFCGMILAEFGASVTIVDKVVNQSDIFRFFSYKLNQTFNKL